MAIELSELLIPVKMGAVAGVGAVVGSIGAVTGEILGTTAAAKDWADSLDELSTKTGLTSTQSAGLAVIAKETGLDIGDMAKSVGFLNKGLVTADGKLGTTGKALKDLGVDVLDANGKMKDTNTILYESSVAISKIKDPAARARTEMALFGKSGTQVDDALSALASGGMADAITKAQQMGLVIGDTGIANAEEMQKNMADLQLTLQGFAVTIGGALLPLLNQLLPVMTSALNRPEVKAAIDAVMQSLILLLNAIMPLIPALMPLIVSILPPLTALFVMVVQAIVPLISQILPPLISLVMTLITAFMPLIAAILPPIIQLFTQVIVAILPLLTTVLPPLITLLAMLITGFMPLIMAVLPLVIQLFTLVIGVLMQIINAVLPPLTTLIGKLTDKFNEWLPVVQGVEKFLSEKLKQAFDGISNAISTVIGWIGKMIDKLLNIKLPDWLTPGSPTPFELGLRGISDAMSEVTRKGLPELTAGLNIKATPLNANKNAQQAPNMPFDMDEFTKSLSRTLRVELQRT